MTEKYENKLKSELENNINSLRSYIYDNNSYKNIINLSKNKKIKNYKINDDKSISNTFNKNKVAINNSDNKKKNNINVYDYMSNSINLVLNLL